MDKYILYQCLSNYIMIEFLIGNASIKICKSSYYMYS